MDPELKLKFEANLQKFSAIAVAVTLWEHDVIKKEIRKYFHDWQSHIHHTPKEANWCVLVKKVTNRSNSLPLSENLMTLVQNLIIPIGEKIFNWNMYVVWTLGLDRDYTYKIYWTPLGTIDEHKCYQKYWVKVAEKSQTTPRLSCLPYDSTIFFLGCLFNEKGFLRAHLEEMRVETALFLFPLKKLNSKCKLHVIIVIWLCVYFGKGKEEAVDLYRKLKKSNSTDKDLFMMCLKDGLLEATKYFWSRLTQAEKKSVIMEGAKKCIKFIEKDYTEEKSVEILVFLINNMTAEERQKFCTENYVDLIRFFMGSWPYQELVEVVYNEFSADDALTSKDAEFTLVYFLRRVLGGTKTGKFVDKELCRRLLKKEYDSTMEETKIKLLFDDDFYVMKLFELFDITILSLILNDEELLNYRDKALNMGYPKFKELIKSKDFELLNKFIENVFHSEAEKKEFKLKISSLPELLSEGNYGLVNDVLNWLSDSAEERILIKKQIDSAKVASMFNNFKPQLIDELLLWQYDTEEERKNAKEAMKDNGFICDKIIKIWNANSKDAKRKCFEFLKWVSGTDDGASELKKSLIIDENEVRIFCETLPSWKKFRRIEELFQFFSATTEKILELKQKIIRNNDEWMNNLVVTQKNYKLAEAVAGWIFTDHSQKKEVMKNYINSKKGAMLLVKAFLSCKVDQVEPLSFLLNSWVKTYGNIDKIKKKLNAIKPAHMGEVSAVACLLFFVDLVRIGARVTEHHINKFLPDEELDPDQVVQLRLESFNLC